MDVYKNDVVNIIVPYWYEKLRYRLQSIKSTGQLFESQELQEKKQ